MKQKVVILTAFKEEYELVKELLNAFKGESRDSCAGYKWINAIHASREITIVQTGQGPFRALAAAKSFVDPSSLIFNFGFCGALREDVKLADVCISQNLKRYSLEKESLLDEIKVNDLAWIQKNHHEFLGSSNLWRNLATVERPIGTPAARKKLFDKTNCDCVDMEAFEIAKVSQTSKAPACIIKVVMDEMDHMISQPIQKNEMEVLMKNLEIARVRLKVVIEKALHFLDGVQG